MKQKKKITPVKKKKRSIPQSGTANPQQRKPVKKYPSKPQPGNVELNESTLVDERDAPTINPNK
jgi:hypothetical protein